MEAVRSANSAVDKFGIDGHKLMYHVDRVSAWSRGENVYPIYMEISPCGSCNHRCSYCGLDFMGYQKRLLDTAVLNERLSELGRLGLKSVMFAGEGEPLLHKDMAKIACHTKDAGVDVAFTTNGVLLSEQVAEEIIGSVAWIKVSINGGTAQTYAAIHGAAAEDFDRVIVNMRYAAQVRGEQGYGCTLGMQLVLLRENHHEVVRLAKLAREIGMDYLVVKPYSQHPQSKTETYKDMRYADFEYLAEELEQFNGDGFSVVFRSRAMADWDQQERRYERCLALPFWSYIDAGGNVWGCSVYLGDERFRYGNINENSFEEIWESDKRRDSLRWVEEQWNAQECRVNCRMDKINRFLWGLKQPPAHVNFI